MPVFEDALGEDLDLESVARAFTRELEAANGRRSLGENALECLDLQRPPRYLDRFSRGDFGDSLLKRLSFVTARVRFVVRGDETATRTLVFEKGTVRDGTASATAPDFTYDLDEGSFRRIVSGKLDPREAFFGGVLKIEGDREMALKFGYLFAAHFAEIDGRILEELGA
jgi:hypothetical protein